MGRLGLRLHPDKTSVVKAKEDRAQGRILDYKLLEKESNFEL